MGSGDMGRVVIWGVVIWSGDMGSGDMGRVVIWGEW